MAEFLVRITLTRPAGMDDEGWAAVLAEEARIASSYRDSGVIHRIWRVPGATGNVGVWRASDATELHRRLSGLPAFPFMGVEVEPLALHYLEGPAEGGTRV
jgi:muconolactone D-isomerase